MSLKRFDGLQKRNEHRKGKEKTTPSTIGNRAIERDRIDKAAQGTREWRTRSKAKRMTLILITRN